MKNREIKFRAWDKLQNKMINAEPFSEEIAIQLGGVVGLFNGKSYDTVTDEFELMQFTGLHDKNGREIYEGDIIQDKYNFDCICGHGEFTDTIPDKRSVKWDLEYLQFKLYHVDQNISQFSGSGSSLCKANSEKRFEVIGNIYEHPDLLK